MGIDYVWTGEFHLSTNTPIEGEKNENSIMIPNIIEFNKYFILTENTLCSYDKNFYSIFLDFHGHTRINDDTLMVGLNELFKELFGNIIDIQGVLSCVSEEIGYHTQITAYIDDHDKIIVKNGGRYDFDSMFYTIDSDGVRYSKEEDYMYKRSLVRKIEKMDNETCKKVIELINKNI